MRDIVTTLGRVPGPRATVRGNRDRARFGSGDLGFAIHRSQGQTDPRDFRRYRVESSRNAGIVA
jgi:hypothetical protein